jgi:hypothetical protein
LARQDRQHLHDQLNSAVNDADARRKYTYRGIFETLIPRFVSKEYEDGPFRLICDEFRPGNMLVNNRNELKIVGIIDWGWSYAAPYQLFFSPPRWLLLKPPADWKVDDDPSLLPRYVDQFQRFLRALRDVERERGYWRRATRGVRADQNLSTLMEESMNSDQFWFNELGLSCFHTPDALAWRQLRAKVRGLENMTRLVPGELDQFAELKTIHLEEYEAKLAERRKEIIGVDAEPEAVKEKPYLNGHKD